MDLILQEVSQDRFIDIPGPVGTPIYATADGVVSRAGWANGYGNLVQITHGSGMETRYGHMSKLLVSPNSSVKRGQIIAKAGQTGNVSGPQLHFEIRKGSSPVDPMPYLDKGGST